MKIEKREMKKRWMPEREKKKKMNYT